MIIMFRHLTHGKWINIIGKSISLTYVRKKKFSEQWDLNENLQDTARIVIEKLEESNAVKKLLVML